MTKKNKLAVALLLTSVSTCVAVAGLTVNQKSVFALAEGQECSHQGNHYTERYATDTQSGCKEYWVCCKCHEHFLTEQEGTWTDLGEAKEIVDASDDRYSPVDTRTELEKQLDEGGFTYTIEGDKVTITGYDASKGANVIIPEGVTNIASGAFKDVDLDVVVLPSTIQKVEGNAFKDSGYAVSNKGGDDFIIYVNMTEKEFKKLKNSSDWNNAYDQSPWGWGLIGVETEKAEVVFLPNWHYVGGIPTKK